MKSIVEILNTLPHFSGSAEYAQHHLGQRPHKNKTDRRQNVGGD